MDNYFYSGAGGGFFEVSTDCRATREKSYCWKALYS